MPYDYSTVEPTCISFSDTAPLSLIDTSPLKGLYDVVIALDTEYTLEEPYPEPPKGITLERIPAYPHDLKNRILSYQLVAANIQTSHQAKQILYPAYGERYTMADILLAGCVQVGIPLKQCRAPEKDHAPRKYKTWKPLKICLVWHWGSAEMGALADRDKLMQDWEQDVVVIGGSPITIRPVKGTIDIGNKHVLPVSLTIRDTARLADEHTKLEDLGEAIGIPKVDIAPYTKDRMDILLERDKALYERYALTDCLIALKWLCETARTNKEVLGLNDIPCTTGSASAKGLQTYLGNDFTRVFNVTSSRGTYNPANRRAANEGFPTQCFLGGMNQTYQLGHVQGAILDLDISGAYAGAMAVLPQINWDKAPITSIIDPWQLTRLMSFALINFTFPGETAYPCLPVPTHHGLVFPLAHNTPEGVYVTGPEIEAALRMGAEVRVIQSMVFPTKDIRLLAPYLAHLAEQRRKYPEKRDPRNAAAKLAMNSLFGKFGQGLCNSYTNAELFSEAEIEEDKKMPRSPVTFPHAAATITGLIRAVLGVLVREGSKMGTVLSATTDGIMLYVPDMTLDAPVVKGKPFLAPPGRLIAACEQHPAVDLFKQGRRNIGEDPDMWLEVKYAGNEAYTVKTRMNWIGWNGEPVHQATVGLKSDHMHVDELRDIRDHRLHRYHTDHTLHKITQVQEGKAADITSYYTSKEVNLAPDWKRQFSLDGSSVPFASIEAWREHRQVVNRLHWQAFPERIELVRNGRRVKPGKDSASSDPLTIRKGVLHRVALGFPGYRLPQGMSERQACKRLRVPLNRLSKLKSVRKLWGDLPEAHPEVQRIQTLLQLW